MGTQTGSDVAPAMVSYEPVLGLLNGRAHLNALLRLGVSQVIHMCDPIQVLACRQVAASQQEASVTLPASQTPLSYCQLGRLKHPDQAIRTGNPIDVGRDFRSSLDYLPCHTPV
jgi:hypothetical protein